MSEPDNTTESETNRVSNEKLYQELRKNLRRIFAVAGLVLAGVGAGLWVINPLAAVPPGLTALLVLIMTVRLHSGKFERFVSLLVDEPVKTEQQLRQELGESYEDPQHARGEA